MRCDREMARVVAAAVLVLANCAHASAVAQERHCVPVREGDSAAALATRLTGDAANRFAQGFQIVDPATRTVVPKSRYDQIQPGWNACIVDPSVPAVTAGATVLPDRIETALVALACDIGAGDPEVIL